MAHPAERISTVPTTNITTTLQSGCPLEQSHKAHKVGQSSSRVPIGLSRRISFSYASIRSARVIVIGDQRQLSLMHASSHRDSVAFYALSSSCRPPSHLRNCHSALAG